MALRAALLAALLLFQPARAAGDPLAAMRTSLGALQADDTRLLTTGWRLVRANAVYCPRVAPGIGAMVYDVRNFAQSGMVRAAMGVAGDIAIGALAEGGPAARAGLIPGEELLAIEGLSAGGDQPVPEGDTARVDGLHDRIDAVLAAQGRITLALASRKLEITGEPACEARFEVATQGVEARSDGRRVQIGQDSLRDVSDADEFAAMVAHELAHAILAHPRRLEAAGRTAAAVRETEREADRLMPWLMANAGYDPEGARGWIENWVRRREGLIRAPTHDGWRRREALVEAEVAAIEAARAGGAAFPLDWRPRFPLNPPSTLRTSSLPAVP